MDNTARFQSYFANINNILTFFINYLLPTAATVDRPRGLMSFAAAGLNLCGILPGDG